MWPAVDRVLVVDQALREASDDRIALEYRDVDTCPGECEDLSRTIDYLETRGDVNMRRVGALGMSMGATLSWWLAALDERYPAQEAGDEVTVGLLTDRLTVDEKTAWMLRSMLA